MITDTLDRLLDPVSRCLTAEAAQALVDLRADPQFQARLDELAEKNTEGRLTSDERAEYDLYFSAISLITVLQSKAKTILRAAEESEGRAENMSSGMASTSPPLNSADFECYLEELSEGLVGLPTLHADFSRSDLYLDHD